MQWHWCAWHWVRHTLWRRRPGPLECFEILCFWYVAVCVLQCLCAYVDKFNCSVISHSFSLSPLSLSLSLPPSLSFPLSFYFGITHILLYAHTFSCHHCYNTEECLSASQDVDVTFHEEVTKFQLRFILHPGQPNTCLSFADKFMFMVDDMDEEIS